MNIYKYDDNIKFECVDLNIINNLFINKKDVYVIFIFKYNSYKYIYYLHAKFNREENNIYRYKMKCLNCTNILRRDLPINISLNDILINEQEGINQLLSVILRDFDSPNRPDIPNDISESNIPRDSNNNPIPFFVFNILTFRNDFINEDFKKKFN